MLFREHRTSAIGVADLLQWGFLVDDGIIVQKDGALLAGWRYRGPDVGAATPEELTQLVQHVNDALLPLTDRWMLHVDAIRRPAHAYAASAFPNAVTALIDAERRDAYPTTGAQFETEYTMVVTYLPPADVYAHVGRWFLRGGTHSGVQWGWVLTTFRQALATLHHRLGAVMHIVPLDSAALLTHLHRCLTALDHPIRVPPYGAYLNSVLADQELVGGFEPRIGRQHIRVVALHGFPNASQIGHLDVLNTLPSAYRWSTRILPLGQAAAAKLIRRHQLQWFKKRKGASAWIRDMTSKSQAPRADDDEAAFRDQDAERLVRDAGDAVAANASGTVRFAFTTQVLVVTDPDAQRADQIASDLVNTVQEAGFPARIETVNALEAFFGSLPGHGAPNVRRPVLSTANIADLLPITGVWPGRAENPSPLFPAHSPPLLWAQTDGSTPFRLNLHEGDVGHTLVIGRTGAGKSTLVGLVTAQFQRYPNAQVYVFDVGYSAWPLAQAAGARHYDLAGPHGQTLAFQPLAGIDDPTERTWATEWLETVIQVQGVSLTPAHRTRLHAALTLLAQNDREHRTLTELVVHLQHPELVAALTPYTMSGPYGELLDATHDAIADGRYQVFELKHLMAMDDRILVPTALYLFHRMEQQLDGSPTLMVFEELWAALMRSVFADTIKQWLLTLRKQNVAVMLIAHSVGQIAQAPNRHILIESCPTRIFLPNPDATGSEVARLYADLGLNAREIDMIARAIPKRQYYIASPSGRRLVDLRLGPVARSFLTVPEGMTAEDMQRRIRVLQAEHGTEWPVQWLIHCGLAAWAERMRADMTARQASSNANATPANPSQTPPPPSFSETTHAHV